MNPLPVRARPQPSCVVPGAPAGRVEVPVLRKAQSGWFGVLDHFSFGCFLAAGRRGGAGPKGDAGKG